MTDRRVEVPQGKPPSTERAARFFPKAATVPRVRPVMQMLLRTEEASDAGRRFAMASVLDWAQQRWPGCSPPEAWSGREFEHDQPGLKMAAVDLADRGMWGFRVEHLGEAGRVWQIEAVISATGRGFDILGARSQCTTRGREDVPATTPRFVGTWLERLPLLDGDNPVSADPIHVSTSAASLELPGLLRDPARQLPVIVLSELPNGGFVIEPSRLARRTTGLAHVVQLHVEQAQELAAVLSRDLAVFNGAVRTYLPGFGQPDDGQVHTNVLPVRIATWPGAEGNGPGAFLEFLVAQMHRYSVATPAKLDQMPGFPQLRRIRAERERALQEAQLEELSRDLATREGNDLDAKLRVVSAELEERNLEIDLLRLDKESAEKNAEDAIALFEEQAVDLDAANEELASLRATNAGLFAGLKRLREARQEPERLPSTYDEIPSWIDETLSDRLVLLGRARRALKAAVYEDVALVAKSLQLLANQYWSLRTAEPESFEAARQAFESRMQELGVDESASISDNRAGEVAEQYTVSYTVGHRSRHVLDRHLRGGANTKDERYCMRIYFFWDGEKQKVIVGHLPSHLDTRAT